MSERDSAYFDDWYANMEASPVKDGILRRNLGLPAELGSAGVLAWEALDELSEHLRLDGASLLADIACGRGGYGIELAIRSGATLIGVDFSGVALEWARRIARHRGARADFTLGTLTATGLPDDAADALMCTDSIQFAEPPLDALREFRRVLRPGGRLALTTWQPTTPGDPELGPRLRHLDLASDLEQAGFHDITVETRPQWYARERAAFEEALSIRDDGTDPALTSFRNEGLRSLENWDALQRVAAFAVRPQGR